MKDGADDRTGELQLDVLRRFVDNGQAAQRAIDQLGAGRPSFERALDEAIADAKRRDAPPKPKRGVSKNASKSADKPERSGR